MSRYTRFSTEKELRSEVENLHGQKLSEEEWLRHGPASHPDWQPPFDKGDIMNILDILPKTKAVPKEVYSSPADTPEFLARLASPWVEQIRQYYFDSPNPEEPLFTENKAKAWIKKNVWLPPKMKASAISQLRRVWVKESDALTEDISGLAKVAGWHEGATLWHVLTGEIPEASKYRIVERRYNYAGPLKADILESRWISIDLDDRFLSLEVVRDAFTKAKRHFKPGKKRIVSLENEAYVSFVKQRMEGRTGTWKKFWEEIRDEWNEQKKTGRKWTTWQMARLHYERTKERLEREEKDKWVCQTR